jgi:MFS family permease
VIPGPVPGARPFAGRLRPASLACLVTTTGLVRFGNSAAMFALPFAVLRHTSDTDAVGVVIGARSAAVLIAFLVAGAGRGSRRVLILAATTASACCLGASGIASLGHTASIGLLAVLAAGQGFTAALPQPVLLALTPEVVETTDLVVANGISRVVSSVASLLAPAVAGVLVAAAGPGWCLLMVATTQILAAVAFCGVQMPGAHHATPPSTQLRDAWQAVRTRRWIVVVVGAFTVISAVWTSWLFVIGPTFVSRQMSEQSWGLLLAVQGAGFIAGGWLATRLRVRRPLLVGLSAMSAAGLPPLALAGSAPFAVVMITAVISGVGVEVFAVLWQATLQGNVPAAQLAPVCAADMFGSSVAMPVCQVAAGPISGLIGSRPSMIVIGSSIIVGSLVTASRPSVRCVPIRADG